MNRRERQACFQHAKKHVMDAIKELISDEHHAIMEYGGKERRDMQLRTEWDMEMFLRTVYKMKFEEVFPLYESRQRQPTATASALSRPVE